MKIEAEWLTADDAAAYLRERRQKRCTSGYLAKLRHIGGGPTFYRINGKVAYLQDDLDAYANTPRIEGPFRKASDATVAADEVAA
jgi:hypothetical protein